MVFPILSSISSIQETKTHTLRQLYSVNSVTTMGRMAKNRKVEESAETVWLNMVSKGASLRSAAGCNSRAVDKCGGKPVSGKDHMKHHETNQRSGQRGQKFIEQVHEKASFLASQSQATVFVGQWME